VKKNIPLILNILTLIFIIGFSFVLIAFLGTTDFGRKFNLITGELFSNKILDLVMFTAGSIGTYVFLYKIWISENERVRNYYFLFGFSILNIIASISLILWLQNILENIQVEFLEIPFATEVDLVIKNVRSNILESVCYMTSTLMFVGIVSLVLGFYHLKTLKKD